MSIKDKLMIYIYQKLTALENERKELRQHVRYQPLDSLDMYEVMREEIRISAWEEFVHELFTIVLNCK